MSSQSTQSTDSCEDREPELNEGEIDSYIISTPLKRPSKTKPQTTPKSKKSTYVFKEGYLLTPASEISSKGDENETMKQVGWLGHDARQWKRAGDHTPPRAGWKSRKG